MENILDKNKLSGEEEKSLRPTKMSDYIGQEELKKIVSVFIKSAQIRKDTVDHLLFYGPPGLGKTTIAGIIANEMGSNLKITSGPIIEKPGDLVSMIVSLEEGDVLFIDEIHRISKNIEEILYSAMEDFAIDILVGEGASAQSIRLNLPKFTLIGATTRAGMLSAPLRDRFGALCRLELYKPSELKEIVRRDAKLINIEIDDKGLDEIAIRSRGTPRIAIRLLKRLRDFAVVNNNGIVDQALANESLALLGVDSNGLDSNDLRIMNAIYYNFNGGPVGLETLCSFIGEDASTIEDVCEPFLMQSGFLIKTPKGRMLTDAGIAWITKNKKSDN